jgi:hypothetical protein
MSSSNLSVRDTQQAVIQATKSAVFGEALDVLLRFPSFSEIHYLFQKMLRPSVWSGHSDSTSVLDRGYEKSRSDE